MQNKPYHNKENISASHCHLSLSSSMVSTSHRHLSRSSSITMHILKMLFYKLSFEHRLFCNHFSFNTQHQFLPQLKKCKLYIKAQQKQSILKFCKMQSYPKNFWRKIMEAYRECREAILEGGTNYNFPLRSKMPNESIICFKIFWWDISQEGQLLRLW